MKKISIANGNYTDREGNQKTRWVPIGIIGVSQSGKEYVLLDPTVNLAAFRREDGKDMVMCTVYDDTQQNNNQGGYQQQGQQYQQPQQQGGYAPQQQGGYQQQQPTYKYTDANGNQVPPPQNQQQAYPRQ